MDAKVAESWPSETSGGVSCQQGALQTLPSIPFSVIYLVQVCWGGAGAPAQDGSKPKKKVQLTRLDLGVSVVPLGTWPWEPCSRTFANQPPGLIKARQAGPVLRVKNLFRNVQIRRGARRQARVFTGGYQRRTREAILLSSIKAPKPGETRGGATNVAMTPAASPPVMPLTKGSPINI